MPYPYNAYPYYGDYYHYNQEDEEDQIESAE